MRQREQQRKHKVQGQLGDNKSISVTGSYKAVLPRGNSWNHVPNQGEGNMVLIGLKWESWGRDRAKIAKIVAKMITKV